MPDIQGTTRAMTLFLRAFIKNRTGPAPDAWPTPAILRRWLRRPAFLLGLQRVMAAHFFRSDLHLSAASAHAAQNLELLNQHNDLPAPDDKTNFRLLQSQIGIRKSKITEAVHTLRLSHLRQRFASPGLPSRSSSPSSIPDTVEDLPRHLQLRFLQQALDLLTRGHQADTVAEAQAFWATRLENLRADLQRNKNDPTPSQFARDLK